jgi:hypothetical protein
MSRFYKYVPFFFDYSFFTGSDWEGFFHFDKKILSMFLYDLKLFPRQIFI